MTGKDYPGPQAATGATQALGIQPDGKILVGGAISKYNNTGALTALKRLLPDGSLDPAFLPNASFDDGPHTTVVNESSEVNAILVNEDGSFYIGGVFENYGADHTARTMVAKINADGSLNTTFVPPFFGSNGAGRYVMSLALDADGGLLVGGAFAASGKHNLVRLDAETGAVDDSFNANAVLAGNSSVVDCISVANDGRIYVSGQANSRPMAKRLLAGGEEDNSFFVSFANESGRVNRILALPNGLVILGGLYDLEGRADVDFLTGHTSTGALSNSFMANLGSSTNGWVGGVLRLMPDGRILAGGIFNTFNSEPTASLVILNADGTQDTSFTPTPYSNDRNSYVTHMYDAVVQADGKIVAGGWFTRITDPDLEINNLVRFDGEDVSGAGSLKFASAVYSVLENAGVAKVQVARVGGITGAVSIGYATGGGASTAAAGTDYTSTNGTLTWADGEGGAKVITIPLVDNAQAAAAKLLRVYLTPPTGGSSLGNPAETLITLLDDDSAPSVITPPAGVTLNQGATLRLSVVVDSPLPVTYQWQFDGGGGFGNLNGATSRELILSQVTPEANAGQYRVLVANANGETISVAAAVVVNVPAGSVIPSFNAAASYPVVKAVYDSQGRILTATSSTITVLRRLADGSLDGTFNAPVFSSTLTDVLPLPDGKVLVSGFFTTVGGVSRQGVARLNANGTLDESFNLNLTYSVQSLGQAANGRFYVGGSGGNNLKRYLANGTLDASFAPVAIGTGNTNGSVWAIRENGDGTMFVAHQVGVGIGNTTYGFAKLNVSDGSAVSGFSIPTLNWNIYNWDFLPDGRIVIGGRFSLVGGAIYNRVAILNADGSVDSSFNVGTGPNGPVLGVKYLNGRILAWGEFTQFNGGSPRALVRLNLDGSLDESFVIGTGAGSNVNSVLLTAENDFMIFGAFTSFNGVSRSYIAKLVGGPQAVGFEPSAYTVVEGDTTLSLTVRRYGSTVGAASVEFETVDGTAEADTDYLATFGTLTWADGDASDRTIQVTLLDNGAIESARQFQVRLINPLGDIMPAAPATVTVLDDDTPVTFTGHPVATTSLIAGEALNLSATATSPTAISYQWYLNGKPVGGAISTTLSIASITQAQAGLYVLVATNAAGSFSSQSAQVIVTSRSGGIAEGQATSGRPVFSGSPQSIVALEDGGALVGGFFSASVPNNVPQPYLIKLGADGATDSSFVMALNNVVRVLLLQPDGKILVGGDFTSPATRLMRLNSDLTLDATFNTNVGSTISAGQVNDLALDSTGRIYVGTSSGSTGAIKRFSSAGESDVDYNPAVNQQVLKLAVQTDDKLLVAGYFTQLAGSSASRFGRLNTDGTRDTTFTSGIGGSANYNEVTVIRDGRIFVGGSSFANSAVLALVSDTGAFSSNMGSGNQVYQLSQAPNGKVVVVRTSSGGNGSVYRIKASNPLPVPGSSDGDSTFNIGTGPNADVKAVTHGADGAIWLAGDFNSFNGVSTGGVVKLVGDPSDPGIVNPPVSIGANAGATAQFSVGAVGTNLTYQWFKDGEPLSDGGNVSGATTAVLTIGNVGLADDDDYTVEVTGGNPSNTVTSGSVHLYLLGEPLVVTSPADATPERGSTLILAAEVLAATPATYEWRRDGVLIVNGGRYSGANTDTLIITGANSGDDGSYVLTVTNSLGTASTEAALVTVNQLPADRDVTVSARTSSGTNANIYVNHFIHLPDGRTLIAARGSITGTNTSGGSVTLSSQLVVVDVDGNISTSPAGDFAAGVGVNGFFAQPDGKILVYGGFTSVGGTGGAGRAGVARLNADLTLDTSFVPPAPFSTINAVALDEEGRIYVAGGFTVYAGNSGYNYLVRLNTNGSLDTSFKPGLNSAVLKLVMQPDGKILVGGAFASYNPSGTPIDVPGLMRIHADGSVDSSFAPALPTGSSVQAISVDAAGRIIVSRDNTPYTLVRLLPTGSTDSSFNFTETLNAYASALWAMPNGKVVVGGGFTTPTNRLFRVNEDGSLDSSFDVGTGFNSGAVTAIVPDLRGRLWIGGNGFNQYKGLQANRMLVLVGDGPELQFLAQPASQVVDVGAASVQFSATILSNNGFSYQWKKNGTPLSDGGRISGATTGTLTLQNIALTDAADYTVTVTSPSAAITSDAAALTVLEAPEITLDPLARIEALGTTVIFTGAARGAGTLSYQWLRFGNPVANGGVVSGATTPTLTIAGADFSHAGDYSLRVTNGYGSATTAVANLTVEKRPGALAGDRVQPTFNSDVNAIHMYPDGSYLVGGGFTRVTINGVNTNVGRIVKFSSNGTLDTTFAPSFNGSINAIDVDTEGRIFVGGNFNSVTVGGTTTTVTRVARLTSAGALDTAFNTEAGPNNTVLALAAVGDGSVYIGGRFTQVGSNSTAAVNRMTKLAANGSVAGNFTSGATNDVNCILRLANGTLYVGGSSNTWGTNAAARLVKLSATGTRDGGFESPSISNIINDVMQLPDGSLFVAGNTGTPYLKRLNASTGADFGFSVSGHVSEVNTVARQPDGKLLSGALGTLIRMNDLFEADNGLNVSFNSKILDIAVDAQGRIYVGGSFYQMNGQTQDRFAILTGGEFESRDGYLPSQTITFADPADRTFNPAANSFTVSATSSSNLPVTIEVTSGPATISGNTVTITGAGEVTLTATQAGNANFAAATPVVQSFTVAKASQTLTFAALGDRSMLSMPFALSATSSSGLPVSFELVSGPASLNGATLTLNGTEGTVTVRAVQAGNANYLAASSIERSFQALDIPPEPEPQTLTFAPLPDRLAEDGAFTLSASASSGLTVTFELVSGPVTLEGNLVTPTGASGLVTIRATQEGDAAWLAASPVTRSFFLTGNTPVVKSAQTINFITPTSRYLDEESIELAAYATSGLPVVYQVSGPATLSGDHTLILDEIGTVVVTATQPGNAAYLPAKPVTRKIKILPAPTKLMLTNLVQTYDGTPRAVGYTGVDEETEVTITYSGSETPPTNAGKYAVVAQAGKVKKTGSLVINKAPVFVRPNDQRVLAGGELPQLDASYTGFIGDDSELTVFDDPGAKPAVKAPVLTTTAKATSPGGQYPIKAAGGVAVNYTFVYALGTLTIDGFGGRYEAILADETTELPVAKVEITVTTNSASFSGKLTTPSELAALSFKGSLLTDPETETTSGSAEFSKGGNSYVLDFTLPLDGTFAATLLLNDEVIGETSSGRELLVLGKGEKPSYLGVHTLTLFSAEEVGAPSGSAFPLGSGYATATVDAKGVMKVAGKLADGTTLTASLYADDEAGFRLFVLPYKRLQSYVAGWINLEDHPDLESRKYVSYDSETDLAWQKAGSAKDKSYRDGFGPLLTRIALDPWLPPAKASKTTSAISLAERLGLDESGEFTVLYTEIVSDSFINLPDVVALDAKNKVAVISPETTPLNVTKWKVLVSPTTGVFKGSFVLADEKSRTVAFNGVMRQPSSTDTDTSGIIGGGSFLLPALPTDPTNEITSGEIQFSLGFPE